MKTPLRFATVILLAAALATPLTHADPTEPVTINMHDTELADVLRLLAEYEGTNIVIDPDVDDIVTLRLDELPLDQAWHVVLETNDLLREDLAGVAHILPREDVIEEIVDTTPPSPLETRVIGLRHIVLSPMTGGASDVGIPLLGGGNASSSSLSSGASFISGGAAARSPNASNIENILRGHLLHIEAQIETDTLTNTVIITDSPSNFPRLLALIDRLDQPVPQILIEARVVEGRRNFLHDLGIRWGGFSVGTDPTSDGNSSTVRSNFVDDVPTEIISFDDGTRYGDFAFGYLSKRFDINVELTALEEEGDAQVLSQPRIMTLNNIQALIVDGQEIRVPSGISDAGVTSFESRTAALQLRVTPQVHDGDGIRMALNVSREDINFAQIVNGTPVIATQVADCVVGMRSGETLVIGGILIDRESETISEIPLISRIPLLGPALFRRTQTHTEQIEVAVFVTPHIVLPHRANAEIASAR